ncbi:MAG: helix-turn-helix transcriptional regulator [Actinobacteria bacterium]|nr:helix-turn-helix transcriptional regulator [Actinomycetota bacterium]
MRTIALITQGCCPPLMKTPIDEAEAERLAGAFKLLGDPGRLRLLSLIAAHPGGEACVCELTEPLGLSQPTVSHHLKLLHQAGLLEREKRSTWVYYKVDPATLKTVRDALAI